MCCHFVLVLSLSVILKGVHIWQLYTAMKFGMASSDFHSVSLKTGLQRQQSSGVHGWDPRQDVEAIALCEMRRPDAAAAEGSLDQLPAVHHRTFDIRGFV